MQRNLEGEEGSVDRVMKTSGVRESVYCAVVSFAV
jgi:hypothetical protein